MRRGLWLAVVLLTPLWPGPAAIGRPAATPVRGVVLDPSGRPIDGARIWLRGANGGCLFVPGQAYARTTTDASGAFALPAPTSPTELYVVHPDFAPGWGSAEDGAVLRLRAAAWLEGELPAGTTVSVTRGVFPLATAVSNGAFRCGPLPPDERLAVSVHSPRHRPVHQRLVLDEGEVRPLALRLDEGATLEGRLVPPRGGVWLRASQGEAHEVHATSDDDGRFRLSGLREGPVRVVALFGDRPALVVDGRAGEPLEVRW